MDNKMVGFKNNIKLFKKLADANNLSHAYVFFGEPQVGKFRFAFSLANYLEKGNFEFLENDLLEEKLVVSPAENGSIGIGAARLLTEFLLKKPVFSKYRTAIVRDAENLTPEAQNALLKTVEDSPPQSLIIFICSNPELLLPSLLSRTQKIYFPRIPIEEIKEFLISVYGKKFNREEIKSAAENSFGRPGRAIDLFFDGESNKIEKLAKQMIKENFRNGASEEILDSDEKIDRLFEFLLADLSREPLKNFKIIKEILKRLTFIKMLNTNKKLQFKALEN